MVKCLSTKSGLKFSGLCLFVVVALFGVSTVSAELKGNRISVLCDGTNGTSGGTEIQLARFNDNKKLYASVGDRLWIENVGSSLMRQIIEVEDGASLHLYLLAELQTTKKKKQASRKRPRKRQQLILTQVGMFSSL
jgi:hypothetical protein